MRDASDIRQNVTRLVERRGKAVVGEEVMRE
jgi:hypothetical protein